MSNYSYCKCPKCDYIGVMETAIPMTDVEKNIANAFENLGIKYEFVGGGFGSPDFIVGDNEIYYDGHDPNNKITIMKMSRK